MSEQALQCISVEAGQDLSANQYRFMAVAADGQIDPVGSSGAAADGVLQDTPAAAGRPANLAIGGVSRVVAGAAVTRGGLVQSDNVGRAINKTTTGTALGRALAAAGAAGDIIPVLLKL